MRAEIFNYWIYFKNFVISNAKTEHYCVQSGEELQIAGQGAGASRSSATAPRKATQRRNIPIHWNVAVAKRLGFPQETNLPAQKARRDDVRMFWIGISYKNTADYSAANFVSAVCKPSSVLDGHLSRPAVASRLQRLPEGVTGRHICPPINLAPGGVYRADMSPCRW